MHVANFMNFLQWNGYQSKWHPGYNRGQCHDEKGFGKSLVLLAPFSRYSRIVFLEKIQMNLYKMLTANTPITARDVKIRGATRGNAESGRSSGEKLISATNIPQAHGHKTPWT